MVLELISGQAYPDRCRSNGCSVCLPLNARRRCLAITLAAPQRMIRLSLVAHDSDDNPCATALRRVKLISRNLKRMGRDPGQWTFTIERNPKGTGFHAHCLQHGPSIPQAELQESCIRAGAGFPHINAITRTAHQTTRYGLKGFGADGYGLKTFRPNGDPADALRINHGRLEHHSRAFFAIEGNALRVRDMERVAIATMNGDTRVAYIGCASGQVDAILADRNLRDSLIRDTQLRLAAKLRALA